MFSLKEAFAGPMTQGCCGRRRDPRARGRQLTEDGVSMSRALAACSVLLLCSAHRFLCAAPFLQPQSGGTGRQLLRVFSTSRQVSRHCHLEQTRRTAESLRVRPVLASFPKTVYLCTFRNPSRAQGVLAWAIKRVALVRVFFYFALVA